MADKWVQVAGLFDLDAQQGELISIQPATLRVEPEPIEDSPLRIIGYSAVGEVLIDLPIEPEFGSCEPDERSGTFQAYVRVSAEVRHLVLTVNGAEAASFTPGESQQVTPNSFDFGPRVGSHTVSLMADETPTDAAAYTLQARPKGAAIWETLDVGLPSVGAGQVDVNQFPGAEIIEVRVLKSTGFEETEVHRSELDFGVTAATDADGS